MTMLTQRGVILAKIEANHAPATPTSLLNAVQIFDFGIDVVPEMLERDPYRQSLSQLKTLLGKTYVEVTFQTEFKGAGVAATVPRWSPLMEACTLTRSYVAPDSHWAPVSTGLKSCTIWAYVDGIEHKVDYCMGSAEFVFEAGQIPKINWTFRGFYALPLDEPVPTDCVYDPSTPVICMAASMLEVGDGIVTPTVRSFTVNLNNTIAPLDDINTASGIKGFVITARNLAGTLIVNAELRATANEDYWSYWANRTVKLLKISLDDGLDAGNFMSLSCPYCYINDVSYGDADGIRTMEFPFKAALSSGDDEILIIQED